jgi:hypothetical protein
MQVTFELNLKITGRSLDEIDQGLTEAASQRIMARLQKGDSPLTGVKEVVNERIHGHTVSATPAPLTQEVAATAVTAVEKVEKEKRKPRAQKGELNEENNKKENSQKENGEAQNQNSAQVNPFAAQPAATKDEAIQALGRVNTKFGSESAKAGIGKVKECLLKFGAASVSKMDASKYGEFIAHCDQVCA